MAITCITPENVVEEQASSQDVQTPQTRSDKIWTQYGTRNPEFAEKLIDRITKRMSPDHIWDLQLGGPDTIENLRFLDRFTNENLGMQQIWPQIRKIPENTPIRIHIKE